MNHDLTSGKRLIQQALLVLATCTSSAVAYGFQEVPPEVQPAPGLEQSPTTQQPASTATPIDKEAPPAIASPADPRLSAEDRASIARAKDLAIAFRAAAERVIPSVVTILSSTKEPDPRDEALGLVAEDEQFDNIGSGVITDPTGVIITNNHVVANAKQVKVRLSDGREFNGEDIRTDPTSDLAILRIDATDSLPAVPLANSDNLNVGDWVLAIGSPFSLESTVSAGIISGKARALQGLVRGQLLQTDAAINPGNSGGPLVSLDGDIVGINTAIASRTGAFQGVGFAIPANRVRWVTRELAANKTVRRAMIGVRSEMIPQKVAKQLQLPVRGGAYVVQVTTGNAADKAGVKIGDIIVELGSQPIRTNDDLREVVEQLPVGSPLPLMVIRDGNKLTLEVNLEARK